MACCRSLSQTWQLFCVERKDCSNKYQISHQKVIDKIQDTAIMPGLSGTSPFKNLANVR